MANENNKNEALDNNNSQSGFQDQQPGGSVLDFDFDLSSFMEDNDQLDESVATNELREANKKLPDWNLVPPEGYLESLK